MWHIVAIGYLFCCRDVFRRAAEYCARVDLFGFLGSVAHCVHGLCRDHPPPQPLDETTGAGGV